MTTARIAYICLVALVAMSSGAVGQVNADRTGPATEFLDVGYSAKLFYETEESLLALRAEPQGHQILTVFHVDRRISFNQTHLRGIRSLLEEYYDLEARLTNTR